MTDTDRPDRPSHTLPASDNGLRRVYPLPAITGLVSPWVASYPLLQADPIPWDFPLPARIIAIGDLHGDLKAFAALAYQAALIDRTGQWVGGPAHLVLLGDLVGGHKDSRLLLDMIMRLETEAQAQGGHVHALLGNHDLLPAQGLMHAMSPKEIKRFEGIAAATEAFRGHTKYAKWLRRRSAIVRIGPWLFVHAGLDRWALFTEPGRINATVRAWIRHWQNLTPSPPEDTRWVVASQAWCKRFNFHPGPLWNRSLKVKHGPNGHYHCPLTHPMAPTTLKAILKHWQAQKLVVGHSPLASGRILFVHPTYRNDVVMIDTDISRTYDTLSALTISAGQATPLYVPDREYGRIIKFHEKRRIRCRFAEVP